MNLFVGLDVSLEKTDLRDQRAWQDREGRAGRFENRHALAVPPDDLDQITGSAAKDKQVTGERFLLQHRLRPGRERREPAPHAVHPRRQPHAGVRWDRDHPSSSRISRTSASGPEAPLIRNR